MSSQSNHRDVDKAARDRYGEAEAGDPDSVLRYLKSLKIIAASDGFSEAERASLHAEMRKMGLSEEVFGAIDSFDAAGAKLEDVLPPATGKHNQRAMLVYDAIKLAHADGYSDKERAATVDAAKKLAVSASTVRALEHVVKMERDLRDLRHALFSGE